MTEAPAPDAAPSDPAPAHLRPLRRPVLRPGLRVVRRDDRHLQVGIDPPHRLVVPDSPDVRRLLGELRHGLGPAPGTAETRRVLARLLERDLLVDGVRLSDLLANAPDRAAVLAAYAAYGDDAARRLAARAGARVAVDAPPDLARTAVRLLSASGLPVGPGEASAAPAALLVVADAAVPRDRLDQAVRAGVPHLLVQGGPGTLEVGPFVVPGLTACVRCVDAHRGEHDPRRSLVLEQWAGAATGTEPRDPALTALALAWAVRDLVAFVDGDEPGTWSATVALGGDPEAGPRRFTRHPHCGCAWGDSLAV